MRGWFDAFRNDGGPTLYSSSNRTPVTGDMPTITLCVLFFTLFAAFLVIFPGIRKERFTTFTTVTLSLFVGTVILVCNYGSDWHVAETHIASTYRAFSREKIMADIGVYIGLKHVNVTLKGEEPVYNQSEDIDYNERLFWEGPTEIQDEFRAALVKGLPYPILTVAEYLSLDEEGFCWGRSYRSAGYYGSHLLWTCFASWMVMNLLLVVVPRYGAYMMVLTGALMLITNLLYYALLPKRPLVIRFEEKVLNFRFGWCYWLILCAGAICLLIGLVITIVDLVYPHKFSTILEVDYDTPYDRHIIIEESHYTRKKKKLPRLEEPPMAGLGSKLLRRLSKRDRYEEPHGLDNDGFEMDPPKSPWRYPHLMLRNDFGHKSSPKSVSFRRQSRVDGLSSLPDNLRRTDSKISTLSSDSGASIPGLETTVQMHPPELLTFQDQFRSIQRQDSQQSTGNSSVSSFGLSFLSRVNSYRDSFMGGRSAASTADCRNSGKSKTRRDERVLSIPVSGGSSHLNNSKSLAADETSMYVHRTLGRSASVRDTVSTTTIVPHAAVEISPGTTLLRRNSGENLREGSSSVW